MSYGTPQAKLAKVFLREGLGTALVKLCHLATGDANFWGRSPDNMSVNVEPLFIHSSCQVESEIAQGAEDRVERSTIVSNFYACFDLLTITVNVAPVQIRFVPPIDVSVTEDGKACSDVLGTNGKLNKEDA